MYIPNSKRPELNSVTTHRLPWQPQFCDPRNTQGIYGHLESRYSKLFWFLLCHKRTSFGCIVLLLQQILLARVHQMHTFLAMSLTHNGIVCLFTAPLL
jgi:hypothetical protein